MLKLKKVAVTGGIACGKSSVCQIFKELGAYVISADEVVHHHLSHNHVIIEKVKRLLGADVVAKGKIDRNAVADKVFHESQLLTALEEILHPEVEKDIESHFQKVKQENQHPLFIAEIPVLFESGFISRSAFDAIIVVDASEDHCRERFKRKTGKSDSDFDMRASFQMPMNEKVKLADFVIENNGTMEQLTQEVKTLYKKLTSPQ